MNTEQHQEKHTAEAKYEAGMDQWRLEDPEKFLIRVAQYLSHQYPNPMKVIRAIQG